LKTRYTLLAGAAGLTLTICALASSGSAAPTAIQASSAGCSGPLDIVLSNDDGYAAPGINAVYAALKAAGHDVTMVAPTTNQTGKGGAMAYGGTLDVTHPVAGDPDIVARGGAPPPPGGRGGGGTACGVSGGAARGRRCAARPA
jgi:5'-nucleotidase